MSSALKRARKQPENESKELFIIIFIVVQWCFDRSSTENQSIDDAWSLSKLWAWWIIEMNENAEEIWTWKQRMLKLNWVWVKLERSSPHLIVNSFITVALSVFTHSLTTRGFVMHSHLSHSSSPYFRMQPKGHQWMSSLVITLMHVTR